METVVVNLQAESSVSRGDTLTVRYKDGSERTFPFAVGDRVEAGPADQVVSAYQNSVSQISPVIEIGLTPRPRPTGE